MPVALIVDDDETSVRLFEHVLKQEGIDVFSAYTAEDAIEYLQHVTPDILLLDLKLPQRNGVAVIDELIDTNRLTQVHIIVISANDARDYLNDYPIPYLFVAKPVQPKQLRKLISP